MTAPTPAARIVPVTILHHNDSHGNLAKGTVRRLHPAGDADQAGARSTTRLARCCSAAATTSRATRCRTTSSPPRSGFAADGTPIADATLQMQPLIKAFNAMGYDAMTLGNHEFNFGSDDLQGASWARPTFPVLGANVTDTGAYGLAAANGGVGVQPYVEKTVGRGHQGRDPGHHEPPRAELRAAEQHPGPDLQRPAGEGPGARPTSCGPIERRGRGPDAHRVHRESEERRGRQERRHQHGDDRHGPRRHRRLPQPHEPGDWVRRLQVPAHRSSPIPTASRSSISQAYRYNNTLGEIVLGVRAKAGGGYEVVSRDRPLPQR